METSLQSASLEQSIQPSITRSAAAPVPATNVDDIAAALATLPLPPAFQEQKNYVQDALRPPRNAVAANSKATFEQVRTYIKLQADGEKFYDDVDQLILQLMGKNSPLERGVVGPTGGSSVVSMNILGPIFGVYGLYAGSKILSRSANAASYLNELIGVVNTKEVELEKLRQDVAERGPGLHDTLADLDNRIAAMKAYRAGVELSRSEQTFNLTMPGAVQLSASALILTYGIDLMPTIGSGSALFAPAASAALAFAAPVVLGVYAGGSLLKNGVDFLKACNIQKVELSEQESQVMADYLRAYNSGVDESRAFYGLNAAAWSLYVAGAVGLVCIATGAALSHGTMIGLVVGGAFLPLLWDLKWGQKCAPHNALTPHVDRNFLDSMDKRADVWDLLRHERVDLELMMNQILQNLPNHHDDPAEMSLKFWRKISKETRYKYFWQLLPGQSGNRRLATWAAKDLDIVDPAVHEYMVSYTRREIDYLQVKLVQKGMALSSRTSELGAQSDEQLQALLADDFRLFCNDLARLRALRGLATELESIDPNTTRNSLEDVERWNQTRLAFLSVQGLLGFFVTEQYVSEHPDWFEYEVTPGSMLHRRKIVNVRLTEEGFDEITRSFDANLERDFIAAVVDPKTNKYEIETVINLEKTAHRDAKTHGMTMEQYELARGVADWDDPVAG